MKPQIRENAQKNLIILKSGSELNLFMRITILFSAEGACRFWEKMILTFEYLQLLSQGILLNVEIHKGPMLDGDAFFDGVVYAAKLVNPSQLLSFSAENTSTKTVLLIILLLTAIKYAILIYIYLMMASKKRLPNILMTLMRWVFKAQGRVTYFFVSSFWLNLALAAQSGANVLFSWGKASVMAFSIFLMTLEFSFSVVVQAHSSYILPTKSFLAAKDNNAEILTFSQKLLIQILQIIFGNKNQMARNWICTVLNILLSLLRKFYFMTALPLYKIKPLLIQASLIWIVFALHLSCFFQLVANTENVDTRFIVITWIILSILAAKVSYSFLQRKIFKLVTTSLSTSSVMLVHKINAISQLRKAVHKPSQYNGDYAWSYLMSKTITTHMGRNFCLASGSITENISDLFNDYLEKLLAKFPKNDYVKLYAAYFYAKKLKAYGQATRLIADLKSTSRFRIKMSCSILAHKIQMIMRAQYAKSEDHLDLYGFIKSQEYIVRLKEMMVQQARLQSEICEELRHEEPNLSKIYDNSISADKYRQSIQREIKKFNSKVPECNFEPISIFAQYQLRVNHSHHEYREYRKIYDQKWLKFAKSLKGDTLSKENLYQKGNVSLVVSANKGEAGKIVSCEKSTDELLDGDSNLYIGTKVSGLFLPQLKMFDDDLVSNTIEAKNSNQAEDIIRGYIYHKAGYMVVVDYYVNIYPYLTKGLYLSMIIRAVHTERDYILIHENGDIEAVTKRIWKRLGFQNAAKRTVNIEKVSHELSRANLAFNVESERTSGGVFKLPTLSHNKKAGEVVMDDDEALCLYNIYSSEGKTLNFKSLIRESKSHTFYCKISPLNYESTPMKLIMMEKVQQEEDNNDLDDIPPIMQSRVIDLPSIQNEVFDFQNFDEFKTDGFMSPKEFPSSPGLQTLRSPISSERFNLISTRFDDGRKKTLTEGFGYPTSPTLSPLEKIRAKKVEEPEIENNSSDEKDDTETISKEEHILEKDIEMSVAASQISRQSKPAGISRAIRAALEISYQPKSCKILRLIFYVLFLAVFASQIFLKTDLDDTFNSILVNKNILINAQLRTCNMVFLESIIRYLLMVSSGFLADTIGVPRVVFLGTLQTYIVALTQANSVMLSNADSLGQYARSFLFSKDVRMYDVDSTSSFIEMTNFQATDKVISLASESLTISKVDPNLIEPQFEYILQNSFDDLYLKNNDISKLFLESIQDQIQSRRSSTKTYFIIVLVFIAITTTLINFLILRYYRKERDNLITVTKLSPFPLKTVQDRLTQFEKTLQEGNYSFGRKESLKLKQINLRKKRSAKDDSKIPNYRGIKTRYFIYAIRFLVCLFLFVGIIIAAVISAFDALDYVNNRMSQLSFAYGMATKINMDVTIGIELLIPKNIDKLTIENIPIADAMEVALQELVSLRTQVVDNIVQTDLADIPAIHQTIYGDSCKILDYRYALYCNILYAASLDTGLNQQLTVLENMLTARMQNYEKSDKSYSSIQTLQGADFNLLSAVKRCLTGISFLITDILDKDIEGFVSSTKQKGNDILLAFILALVVNFVLIWIFVINKIANSYNQFKKVLQTLPAELILSSFLLKSFIVKTSQGMIDSIKDDR